jgi:tRNA uridine 5-carbamoylmethylation protein Kti12
MSKITEKLLEKLQEINNQKVQDAVNKYQGTTNKKLEKTQKQLNELGKDFDKLQSEAKETIKKIYEIKKTTQDVKGEFIKDMENLRKKNQMETLERKSFLNQIKNTGENHSSSLE